LKATNTLPTTVEKMIFSEAIPYAYSPAGDHQDTSLQVQDVFLKEKRPSLTPEHIKDIGLAATKMKGTDRRAFQAEMTLKYCAGKARQAEEIFGWGRKTVETGLGEKRTGLISLGSQTIYSGRKRWEEHQPKAAEALEQLAEEHAQQDPTFRTTIAYTRLTANEALKQLGSQGFSKEQLPAASTTAEVLNRLDYRLRRVVKAKPHQKIKETDAIFNNIKEKERQREPGTVKRLSMDSKATVKIGDFSRGGYTRGDNQAADHDMGVKEKYIPLGIVDQDTGQLHLTFGSSYKTSDFIIDTLQDWWHDLDPQEQHQTQLIQLKLDNGSESSGVRTQFLKRVVQFSDNIKKPIQLLYYPPYHSKYNPIERCWGILEIHWNGAKLVDVETMLAWAQSMTWKGLHPVIKLSKKIYKKGVSLTKKEMRKVEKRLKRNPLLPKWDILIQPA